MIKVRKWQGVASICVLALAVGACGGTTDESGASSTTVTEPDSPQTTIGAGEPTTTATPSEPITLGVIYDLSGIAASLGTPARDGAQLAVDQINTSGGVLGRNLELSIEDSGCDPANGIAAARKLLDDESTFALFGVACSPVALALRDLANEQEVPLLVTTATATEITEPRTDYVFATNVPAASEAKSLTDNVLAKYGDPDIAVVYVGNDYGRASAEGVSTALADAGKAELLVAEVEVPLTASDYQAQALQLNQADPDVIMIVVYSTPAFIEQAIQAGVDAEWVTFSGGAMSATIEPMHEAGLLQEYTTSYYSSDLMATDSQSDALASFTSAFYAEYGSFPDTLNLQGYNGILVFKEALEQAGSVDRSAFVNAMENLGTIDLGLTFPLHFSPEDHSGADRVSILSFGSGGPGDTGLYGDADIFEQGGS